MWQSDIASISEKLERFMRLSAAGGHRDLENAAATADFPADFFRHLYFMACSFFNQCRFSKAQSLFAFLCFFKREEPFFWQALGLSLMGNAQFAKADSVFSIAGKFGAPDPHTHYYRGQCLVRLGKKEQASRQLELAMIHAKTDTRYSEITKKCRRIMAAMAKDK